VEDRPEYLSSSARGLSLSGLVLFGLYGSIVLGSLFPMQLMLPAWQLKVGATLINASPFPLIGLGLMHLAADLNPDDKLLTNRHNFVARLAVAVSLGFLLLVPLMSVAAVMQQRQRVASQVTLTRRAESNLQALTQVVSSSQSTDELRDRLIALNGPVIDEANAVKPLATLKAEVNDLLQKAAAQVARKSQQLPTIKPWSLLPELLRNAFACLVLAIGFAGLGFRSNSAFPVLAELQLGLEQQKHRITNFLWGAKPGDPYLQKLMEQEEAEDEQEPPAPPLH
jgi:hypothetical protein